MRDGVRPARETLGRSSDLLRADSMPITRAERIARGMLDRHRPG